MDSVNPKFLVDRPERRATLAAKRADYIAGRLSHEDYYLWLGAFIGLRPSILAIPLEEVRHSTDPHLNDITLDRWDRHDPIVRSLAAGLPWSLSDTVCVLKVHARRWAAETDGV